MVFKEAAVAVLVLCLFAVPNSQAGELEWEWQNPLPQGDWINDLWVDADGTVYAAGREGLALRYREGQWEFLTGFSEYEYRGVWGDGEEKVYFAGSYLDESQWRGVVAAYDGESWTELTNTGTYVTGIWGSSPGDIFVTGPFNSVLHYDGESWTHLPTGGSYTLNAVWGSSGDNVFAVGFNGKILRYNGTAWSEMASPAQYELHCVGGAAGDDVYAGGDLGTLFHYNGTAWSEVELEGWSAVRGIEVRGADDIHLAREFGEIYRFDGQDWTSEANPARVKLRAAGGSGVRAAAAGDAGLVMISDNGGPWEAIAGDPDPPNIKAFWGTGPDDVFAVGGYFYGQGKDLHGPVFHYDGSSWTELTRVKEELYSVWGTGSGEVFAGGNDGTILHYDGADWTVMTTGSATQVHGFWGGSGTDVYAVGGYFYSDGGIRSANLIWHYDGDEWTLVPSPGSPGGDPPLPGSGEPILRGIWGHSPEEIFAVGGYNYSQVGYQHAVYHFDGEQWSEMETGVDNYLTGVWGSGPDDVYAIPYAGKILRYDGSSWSVAPNSPDFANLSGIWGTGSNNIYAVGTNGQIHHFNGTAWSRIASPTGQSLEAVWGPGPGEVFLGGMSGAILRGSEPEPPPAATPTATPSPSLTPTPSATPSPSATPTVISTPPPTVPPAPTSTVTPTPEPTPKPSLTPTPAPTATVSCDFRVSGTVLDEVTSSPLDDASVTVTLPDLYSESTMSGPDGIYSFNIFTPHSPGEVILQADYTGYRTGYAYAAWECQTEITGMDILLVPITPVPTISPTPVSTISPTPIPIVTPTPEQPEVVTGIFRPSSGLWAIRGTTRAYFGSQGDTPVYRDYTGDGIGDLAIFRPSSGLWAVRGVTWVYFGGDDDQPVPSDYTGDGTSDIAIFRESSGLWTVRGVTRAYFGTAGDIPIPVDYTGDGTAGLAIFRPASGLWAVRGITSVYFGTLNDTPVPRDYTGDGTRDIGIFRGASGLWAIRGLTRVYFGGSSDLPVPSDYSGDGTDDVGIFRETSGLWAIRGFTRTYFGTVGDVPVTR